MKSENYTPEPWAGMTNGSYNSGHNWSVIDEEADTSCAAPIWADGKVVAFVVTTQYSDTEMDANARRIVACVNACAGTPTRGLEKLSYQFQVEEKLRAIEDVARLNYQRDQLLDALKALTERSSDLASQCGYFKNDIKEIFNAQIIIKAVEQSQ